MKRERERERERSGRGKRKKIFPVVLLSKHPPRGKKKYFFVS
jgi:hypothetical protein